MHVATFMRMSRPVAIAALVAYLAVLAAGTLGSSPAALFAGGERVVDAVTGLESISRVNVERAANVLLFAPAGLLLCYAVPALSRWLVWVLCLAVSVAIESAQLFLAGRESSVIDIATNATGAAIGVLIHLALARNGRATSGGAV